MTFSWKRGFLHALIPFGLLLVATGVLVAADKVADPEKFGEGVGRFGLFVFLGGLGLSYLAQTGRKRAAYGLGLGLIAVIGMLVAVAFVEPHHRARRLTETERAPLVAFDDHGQRRLRHPVFGFSIQHPGAGYAESAAITDVMRKATAKDVQTVYYGYGETPPTTALVIGVFSDAGGTRADFQEVVDGIATATHKQLPGDVTMPLNEMIWTETKHESHFHAVIAGAGHFYVNAYAVHPADRDAFVVALMVITPKPDALANVLTSFRP